MSTISRRIPDRDLRLATRLLKTGSLEPETGTYRWVGGFSELIAAINCKYESSGPVDLSMNTESMDLCFWHPDQQRRWVRYAWTVAALTFRRQVRRPGPDLSAGSAL